MILLRLFLAFLKIGAFTFGGGYGMIALIREDCLANGWLTEEQLLNFIAVAESTPGPIAVNMATLVGSSQGGFFGALLATLGVVLPSFLVILLIASLMKQLIQYPCVKAVLGGFRPAIVGMITATAVTMLLKLLLGIQTLHSEISFDWRSFLVLAAILAMSIGYKTLRKKALSPILLILFSGVMGVLIF